MSLISGKYWTGDPKIKPDAWGPFEDVQAAIYENAYCVYGINPNLISFYIPCWEHAGVIARDYSRNKDNINLSSTSTWSGNGFNVGATDVNFSKNWNTYAPGLYEPFTFFMFDVYLGYSTDSKIFFSSLSSGTGVQFRKNGYGNDLYILCQNSYNSIVISKKPGGYGLYDLCVTRDISGILSLYANSDLLESVYEGGRNLSISIIPSIRSGVEQVKSLLWSRQCLSKSQISNLRDNKYGLLKPITRRSYFIPSGDITIKTISDSGFCSDTISGLSNQLSVLDTGSGIDGFYGMSADLSVSDTGSGSENINPVASISVNDTASAIDIISNILNYCSVVDSVTGADSISNILASIAVADAGSGFDIINVLKELLKTVTDSCLGVDNVSQITVSSSVSDSASSVDIISQILADISVSDTGSGADFLSLIKDILKIISDGGTGVDSVSIQPVSISVQDVGLALDLIGNIAVALSIVDTATADEIISTIKTKLVAVSDSGIGSDNQSISVSLTVADTMTAIDAIKQIINSLSISDAGFGIDAITKIDLDNTPSGRVRITITLKAPGINITSRAPGINISTQ